MTGDVPFAAMMQGEENPTSTPEASAAETAQEDSLPAPAPQEGYFGFTLRELIIVGLWLVAFVVSFVPCAAVVRDGSATVWTMNGAWILTIGVPTAAVFLVVLRRLSPEGIRRVGSLGIDQFASVAFTVALVSWTVLLWQQLDLLAVLHRSALATWPLWLEILCLLGLVVVTVFAALVPGIRDDFEDRTETLAHRNANPVRPVFTRPRPVRARGSVSDPQNDDDVDPGLLHENEVAADTHLSAGATGAAVPGGAGYVPDHHRESFLAAGENPGGSGVMAGGAPDTAADPASGSPAAAEAEAPAAADAPTIAIPEPAASLPDDEAVPPASSEDEPITRAEARRSATSSGSVPTIESAAPSEDDGAAADHPAEDGTAPSGDADAASSTAPSAPRDLSDTMTEVLGDLLVPSPVDDVATHAVDVVEGKDEEAAAPPSGQAQPFWALAPDIRPVHDARGDEIFTIGPDAWILVLEDRGGAFVVRHDDGRVGYLHDTDNMTRG
jgi:hypothetical protein